MYLALSCYKANRAVRAPQSGTFLNVIVSSYKRPDGQTEKPFGEKTKHWRFSCKMVTIFLTDDPTIPTYQALRSKFSELCSILGRNGTAGTVRLSAVNLS
jgi:hypothetical protein